MSDAHAGHTMMRARLRLRPFVARDAPRFTELAGAPRIAEAMISVPHPMSLDIARAEIARFQDECASGWAWSRKAVCADESESQVPITTSCCGLSSKQSGSRLSQEAAYKRPRMTCRMRCDAATRRHQTGGAPP